MKPSTVLIRSKQGSGRRLARAAVLASASIALGLGALAAPASAAPAGYPELSVKLTRLTDMSSVPAGTEVDFTATVTNTGTASSTEYVYLTVAVPLRGGGIRTWPASGGVCQIKVYGLGCAMNRLAPGQSAEVRFGTTREAGYPGTYTVEAQVEPEANELDFANNDVKLVTSVGLYTGSVSATAPAAAQLGRPFTIDVAVSTTSVGGYLPSGTVTVSGPEGSSSAQLVDGVAHIPYTPMMRGARTLHRQLRGRAVHPRLRHDRQGHRLLSPPEPRAAPPKPPEAAPLSPVRDATHGYDRRSGHRGRARPRRASRSRGRSAG